MGMLPANLRPDLDALRVEMAVATLRDVVKDGWSVLALSTGMADALTDQAGIASLGGATYDGTAKTVSNPAPIVNALTGGTATSSTDRGAPNAPALAFDADLSTYFEAQATTGWLRYDPAASFAVAGYALSAPSNETVDRNAKSWTFEGWDGAAWVALDTQVNVPAWSLSERRVYAVANATAYSAYRVNCSANQGGGYWCVGRLEAWPVPVSPAVTVVSAAFALGFQPSLVRIVSPVELGGGVIGVDCLFDASTDGATWGAATLSDLGKFDASTRIVGGLVNLADQPAGSSIYWRWRTNAGIAQTMHGVWLQCK